MLKHIFHLDGFMNKQNMMFWLLKIHIVVEILLDPAKGTM